MGLWREWRWESSSGIVANGNKRQLVPAVAPFVAHVFKVMSQKTQTVSTCLGLFQGLVQVARGARSGIKRAAVIKDFELQTRIAVLVKPQIDLRNVGRGLPGITVHGDVGECFVQAELQLETGAGGPRLLFPNGFQPVQRI